MKKYSIPLTWESYKMYEVEAENLQEAITKAMSQFLKESDDNYVCDSFRVDEIIYEDYRDESFDLDKAIQDIP